MHSNKGSRDADAARELLAEAARLHRGIQSGEIARIVQAAYFIIGALQKRRKIIWFGNGGSATQSQHMAGEFVGRFQTERQALPSISLTENIASVTAIANDYSFEDVFSRQLQGLARSGDVAVGISTSGNSQNVIRALLTAKKMKLRTVGLTGSSGGKMLQLCDVCICVPSTNTARIQEAHLTVGHILCALTEDALSRPIHRGRS